MNPARARQLIRNIVSTGEVSFTRHALEEIAKDDLDTLDCTNVLSGGVVEPGGYGDDVYGVWSRDDNGAGKFSV